MEIISDALIVFPEQVKIVLCAMNFSIKKQLIWKSFLFYGFGTVCLS